MHFFQLAAAWLFPCAVCATLATTAAVDTDGAATVENDSPSSPAVSTGGVTPGADPGSSPSASSTTSSSTSSLIGTRCRSPNSARSPEKQGGSTAAPKGDVMRRCLRRLAKKLQRGSGADNALPDGLRGRKKSRSTKPDRRGAGVVDGTARDREEAVASAIVYCKETMSRRRSDTSPPPPSPSLYGWLLDRPEEASLCKCPALRRDVSLLEWLPEAPACTSSAAVPHHRGCASCDEYGGKAVSGTGKRASRHALTGKLGVGDIYDGLDIDVLRITNYFAAKYVQCNVEQLLSCKQFVADSLLSSILSDFSIIF